MVWFVNCGTLYIELYIFIIRQRGSIESFNGTNVVTRHLFPQLTFLCEELNILKISVLFCSSFQVLNLVNTLNKLRASMFINVTDFQHLEFRKRLQVDSILEDWKPPEVKL